MQLLCTLIVRITYGGRYPCHPWLRNTELGLFGPLQTVRWPLIG